jgi:DNA-binding CsgD family transcriptional regulator
MRAGQLDMQALARASGRLGEAVLDPGKWPEIMDEVCRATGSTGALLLQSDVRTPDVPRTASVDALTNCYFDEGWHLRDLRAERGVPLLLGGEAVLTEADLFTPEELRRAPFYGDMINRHGFAWFAAIGFWAGPSLWALSLQRTAREGLLSAESKQALSPFARRLTEVATLSTAVGRVALTSAAHALDAVLCAAVAVDRLGAVLEANASAYALFDDGFRVHNRRIVVRDNTARTEFDNLFARLRSAEDTATFEAAPIIIRREDKPPLIVNTLPVTALARGPFMSARAFLTVKEAAPKAALNTATIAKAFGLTPAEARLAGLLVEGQSLEDIAERLQLSRGTIRVQLKAVFAKTGMHRQGELVALLTQL